MSLTAWISSAEELIATLYNKDCTKANNKHGWVNCDVIVRNKPYQQVDKTNLDYKSPNI